MQNIYFNKIRFYLTILLFIYSNLNGQDTPLTKGVTVTNSSQADLNQGEIYAIIIGVSKYNKGIPSLRFADADAILFKNYLLSAAGGNANPDNIFFLINDSAKASNFNFRAKNWLKNKKLKQGDRLYLYFSGHGVAMDEENYYFLTNDSEPNSDVSNYETTATIRMSFVKSSIIKPEVNKGVKVMLIMDACRSNEIPGIKDGPAKFTNDFIVERKMGEMYLLSTGPNQVSIESPNIGSGHGLFTYYLVDGLYGAADEIAEGGNDDKKVSFAELSDFTRGKVRKRATSKEFNTQQVPVTCCSDNDLTTISTIDNQTYARWQKRKEIGQLGSDTNSLAINTVKGIRDRNAADSLPTMFYNKFVAALKNNEFTVNSNAEALYAYMVKQWPEHSLTLDAKYMLAATYMNFCHQKINLFLSGKGLAHIIIMGKEVNKDNPDAAIEEEINKLKTIITAEYALADTMMEKAKILLQHDPELWNPVIPKYNFIKTMAAYEKRNKPYSLKNIQQLCRQAIASDPASPAGYLLMGWIYQDMDDDSSFFYFAKAATIAPKWAYPQHGLGNYYFLNHNYDSAKKYFVKALQLDSLYGSAYRNLGMIYFDESGYNYDKKSGITHHDDKALEAAREKFIQAIAIDSCDSDANEYIGKINLAYKNIANAKYKFTIAINCHQDFISGYKNLAALFSDEKKEDKALATLWECVVKNPTNSSALLNLGYYYLNTQIDYDSAEAIYQRAIAIDPFIDKNYFFLAKMFLRKSEQGKALAVYAEAMEKVDNKKALFNEIGNLYLLHSYDLDSAISYYNKALQMDSTIDYVYYNIALAHTAKNAVRDSMIYYKSKAIDYNPYRWQKYISEVADFYWSKNDTTNTIKYNTLLLKFKPHTTFDAYFEEEKLIKILLARKKFADAEKILEQYVDPKMNFYQRLSEILKNADGYAAYLSGKIK